MAYPLPTGFTLVELTMGVLCDFVQPACRKSLTGTVGKDASYRQVRYNNRLFRAAEAGPWPVARRPSSHAIQASEPMLETNPIHNTIKDLSERTDVLRGYL
jgi:hypothetical protein